jgi:hypothetical protein
VLRKNVAGQGVYLFAWDSLNSIPKTGDAANITGSYSLDGVDHTGFSTANPTEMGGGVYWQPLAQGETNANEAAYRWASTTANVQVNPVFKDTDNGGLNANVSAINSVSTSGVTAVGPNIGTAQPVNFSGTGASAYVQVDVEQWRGGQPSVLSSGNVNCNIVQYVGSACPGNVANPGVAITDVRFWQSGNVLSLASGGYVQVDVEQIKTHTAADDGAGHLDVRLANAVAHGGTPGSSTATMALSLLNITSSNPTASAVQIQAGNGTASCVAISVLVSGGAGTNSNALALASTNGYAVTMSGSGTFGGGLFLQGGTGSQPTLFISGSSAGPAIEIDGPSVTPGPAIIVDTTLANAGVAGGPGILITTGAGDGVKIVSVGGHDINLAGDGAIWDSVHGTSVRSTLNGYVTNSVMVASKDLIRALVYIGATTAGALPSGAGSGQENYKDFSGAAAVDATIDQNGNRTAIVYH